MGSLDSSRLRDHIIMRELSIVETRFLQTSSFMHRQGLISNKLWNECNTRPILMVESELSTYCLARVTVPSKIKRIVGSPLDAHLMENINDIFTIFRLAGCCLVLKIDRRACFQIKCVSPAVRESLTNRDSREQRWRNKMAQNKAFLRNDFSIL